MVLGLAACGGGGGGGNDAPAGNNVTGVGGAGDESMPLSVTPPDAPTPSLEYGIKTLRFSWPAVEGATHYRLYENADGASGYSQVGDDITQPHVDHSIALYQRVNASYLIAACNSGGCSDSSALSLSAPELTSAIGYFKASNNDPGDSFGHAVALSADGRTLAVGATGEASNATGIDGDQNNNLGSINGAVYVFIRSGSRWVQQAYLKASNTDRADEFGQTLSISADGNTLAVGTTREDSNSTGVNEKETDNSAEQAGAVYVFSRNGSSWSQQAYVKASNTDAGDWFGAAVALSADGHTLAVGAPWESSAASGIDGNQHDNTLEGSGAVYVFTRSGGDWAQPVYIKAPQSQFRGNFGSALALSADGSTMVVSSASEDVFAPNFGGGAVHVFARSGDRWTHETRVIASNPGAGDSFGSALALSDDGNTLAVGATLEDSAATGIDGNQNDNTSLNSGAVYVFARGDSGWSQQAYVKASNSRASIAFGRAVALSANGNTLAVGAPREDNSASGINGNQHNGLVTDAGAVYVFTRSGDEWSQLAYVKASNTESGTDQDEFGRALALSADGETLAVGAYWEDGASTGIGGDQQHTVDGDSFHGAVYLY